MAADPSSTAGTHSSLHDRINAARWLGPSLVALFSLFYYLIFHRHFISMVDEGLFVNGALRVMHGEQPITDFWAYPPGRYFMLAGVFKCLGIHLTNERYMLIALLSARNVLIYLVARRLLPLSAAILSTLTLTLVPGYWHKVFYALPLFAHLYVLLIYLDKPTVLRAAICGIVSGVILYFRQDLAVFSVIATIFAVIAMQRVRPGSSTASGFATQLKRVVSVSIGHLSIVLATAFIVAVPLILYYAQTPDYNLLMDRLGTDTVQSANVVYEKVEWAPLSQLPRLILRGPGNWLNYRFMNAWSPWVLTFGAGLAVLIGLYTTWLWAWGKHPNAAGAVKYATLLVWSVLAMSRLINLPNMGSCLITGPGAMIVLAVVVVVLWRWARRGSQAVTDKFSLCLPAWPSLLRWFVAVPAITVIMFSWLLFLMLAVIPVARISAGSIACRVDSDTPVRLERADLVLPESQAKALKNVVEQIDLRAGEGQPIIAYRQAMFYFLADRPNATAYDNIIPPVVLPQVAEEMTEIVSRSNPPALHVIDLSELWTRRLLEQYPDDLRSALFTNYQPTYRFGDYVLLEPSPNANAWDLIQPLWIRPNHQTKTANQPK